VNYFLALLGEFSYDDYCYLLPVKQAKQQKCRRSQSTISPKACIIFWNNTRSLLWCLFDACVLLRVHFR